MLMASSSPSAEPVSDVAIASDIPEAVEHNSTVKLTCSAKGSFLKFTWTNGTTPITGDGKRITLASVGFYCQEWRLLNWI